MDSDKLMEWAWTCPVDGSSERLLLLAICRCIAAGEHQTYAELGRATNLHRRTIMTTAKRLEELGAISVTRTSGTANQYEPRLPGGEVMDISRSHVARKSTMRVSNNMDAQQ